MRARIVLKPGIMGLLLAAFAIGQTTTTANPTPASANTTSTATASAATTALPSSWIIGTGVERNTYGNTPAWVPFIHIMGCWTAFCEISTVEMPAGAGAATIRQDFGYKMKASADNTTMLIAIVGGSLTTTSNPSAQTLSASVIPSSVVLGGIGGGFAARVDPGLIPKLKAIKGKGLSLWGEFREASVTSIGVKPQFAAALNYRWK